MEKLEENGVHEGEEQLDPTQEEEKKSKKKNKKKKKKAGDEGEEQKEAAAAEATAPVPEPTGEGEEGLEEGEEEEGGDKKKKKKKRKKKGKGEGAEEESKVTYSRAQDNSHFRLIANWQEGPYRQTTPPTIPIDEQFADGVYPIGEIVEYNDGGKRISAAELRENERLLSYDYECLRQAAEVHR